MRMTVIGPRGGLSVTDVNCDTCVCAGKCGYSGPSRMGCLDWVSPDGRRWYSFSTHGVPDNIEAAIPLQRELNALQSQRIENLEQTRARIEHVREEVEEGRLAPADIDIDTAEATMEPDPKEESHD